MSTFAFDEEALISVNVAFKAKYKPKDKLQPPFHYTISKNQPAGKTNSKHSSNEIKMTQI